MPHWLRLGGAILFNSGVIANNEEHEAGEEHEGGGGDADGDGVFEGEDEVAGCGGDEAFEAACGAVGAHVGGDFFVRGDFGDPEVPNEHAAGEGEAVEGRADGEHDEIC